MGTTSAVERIEGLKQKAFEPLARRIARLNTAIGLTVPVAICLSLIGDPFRWRWVTVLLLVGFTALRHLAFLVTANRRAKMKLVSDPGIGMTIVAAAVVGVLFTATGGAESPYLGLSLVLVYDL